MRHVVRLHAPLRSIAVHRAAAAEQAPAPVVARLRALEQRATRERDEHTAALRALQAVGAAAGAARAEIGQALRELAQQAVELGLSIAREVVSDAIERGGLDPLPAVLACLEAAASEGPQIEIRLAPPDLERVMSRIAADPELRAHTHGCTFTADASLAHGEVRARSGLREIARDPREVFERIAVELRKAAHA